MISFLKGICKESFWLKILTSGIHIEDTQFFSRLLVANAVLYVVGALVGFFTIYHLLITGNYVIALFDALALFFVTALLIQLRIKKSLQMFGHFMAVGTVVIYCFFMGTTQNENMSFIWVVFLPFFIILVNGWKKGLWYVLSFFAIMFPLAYLNIGVWDNGEWNSVHFYRLVASLILALMIALLIDYTKVLAHKRESGMRQKELLYLNELKIMSRTDGLTGLYNRHYFNQVFQEKINELAHAKHSLMFFIVDIDYFKAYNDYYGHQAGDEVIQRIAVAIRKFIQRENDLVFRLGGEEFGGLLDARKPEKMAQWLKQLSQVVESLKIKHAPGVGLPFVTISGGVSTMKPASSITMEELYRNADKALYKAKNEGRNRFVIDNRYQTNDGDEHYHGEILNQKILKGK